MSSSRGMTADFKCLKGPSRRVRGLLWWSSGKESACQCKGHSFDLWSKKTPHAVGQLSPDAITTEPAQPRARRSSRGN